MKASEAQRLCVTFIKHDIPVMLSGASGIGKSDMVRQICKDVLGECNDKNFIDFRALLRDQTDLKGIGFPNKDKGTTDWFRPSDLPFIGNDQYDDECFLFFDEVNAATMSMQAALFGLVLDRRAGPHMLKPGVKILAAGNRIKDKAAAQRMPSALANRFAHIEMDPDANDWALWADANGVNMMVTAFIRFKPEYIHRMIPDEGEELGAFSTPRSITAAAKVIDGLTDYHQMYALSAALCGKAFATEFIGFAKLFNELPPIESIIANPKGSIIPKELSAKYAVTTALARKADLKNWNNIMIYAERLAKEGGKKDLEVTLIGSAVRRDTKLMQTKAYIDWSVTNHNILS